MPSSDIDWEELIGLPVFWQAGQDFWSLIDNRAFYYLISQHWRGHQSLGVDFLWVERLQQEKKVGALFLLHKCKHSRLQPYAFL